MAPLKSGVPLEAELKAFFAAKERQARALAAQEQKEMAPEVWPFFAAGVKGDWGTMTNLYNAMAVRSCHFAVSSNHVDERLCLMVWETVNETYRVYEKLAFGDPTYMQLFGQEIIALVPAGSIYFGDTDPGRFMVTFLSKSSETGEPFFILSQNPLTGGWYLPYLETMYGGKLQLPTPEDQHRAFGDYLSDAKRRLGNGRLKPGEDVRLVDGQVQVQGLVAVFAVIGRLSKFIFDRNADRRFFLNEYYPQEWMNPHLFPHGLLMEIKHEPMPALTEEVVVKDRDYWSRQLAPLIGNWLNPDTSVSEICEFVERVHLRGDFHGFHGDPQFVKSAKAEPSQVGCHLKASWIYGAARGSIARVYGWRAEQSQATEERSRMIAAADFAFRQTFALCPYMPEPPWRHVNLLLRQSRKAEALRVAQTVEMLHPKEPQYRDWVKQVADFGQQQPK